MHQLSHNVDTRSMDLDILLMSYFIKGYDLWGFLTVGDTQTVTTAVQSLTKTDLFVLLVECTEMFAHPVLLVQQLGVEIPEQLNQSSGRHHHI